MYELIKSINERGGGLIIVLTVIILCITGLYRLHNEDLAEINGRVKGLEKTSTERSETLHSHDKRITILEYKNDN